MSSWIETNHVVIFTIIGIIIGAWLITEFGQLIIRKAVSRVIRPDMFKTIAEEKKREDTVVQIIAGALRILIWPLAIISVIDQFGVDIGPLVAGAGIVGVALGFGAQSLVKDIIAGLFIIMENQYGVGDVVSLDGTSGLVEHISLRKTTLRDLDGIVHHIPNGTITRASNLSSEFSGINLNVNVAYDSDIEKVARVVNEVGESMSKDEVLGESILEPPKFLRVDDFGDHAMVVKITGKVKPLTQWDVTGELRKQLKIAFDKAGIEIPLPQRVVRQKTVKK